MENLQGQRIVITRALEDFPAAAEAVRRLGGEPIACPAISLVPPSDTEPLDRVLRSLRDFDWVFFTSPHAVQFFFRRFESLSIPQEMFDRIQTASVGSATTEALRQHGINPDFEAEEYTGEEMFREWSRIHSTQGTRFLLPVSSLARDRLSRLIQENGGQVIAVTAYENRPVTEFPPDVLELFQRNAMDWVTFFSSSAAVNFYQMLEKYPHIQARYAVASIGPSTTETLRSLNVVVTIEAQPHTLEGLLNAIIHRIASPSPPPAK